MSHILEIPIQGYDVGTELKDVSLKEARAMECNRCGGCCNGLLPDDIVKKDPTTGLPLFVWGDKFPQDLYESRYGQKLLQPIGFLEDSSEMPYQGQIGIVDKFEEDENNKPYSCFSCSYHSMQDGLAVCGLKEAYGDGNPNDISTVRPLNCGEFPVFSSIVDNELIAGRNFIPAVGTLPACTWYGIRITGPYKDTEYWRDRWQKQQANEEVPSLEIPREFIDGLLYKAESKQQNNAK